VLAQSQSRDLTTPSVIAPMLQLSIETITKWGLRGFLLLTHARLHPRVPATKCCLQVLI
jgi:hypothetical protein